MTEEAEVVGKAADAQGPTSASETSRAAVRNPEAREPGLLETEPLETEPLEAVQWEAVQWETVVEGLRFPEGPIVLDDGSLVLVEIERGTLSRIATDGNVTVIAELGGGPNGAAIGPDGRCYVCNNGGFEWREQGGLLIPGHQPADYAGGSIQVVDLETGRFETLYDACDGRPLRGPNDLVFDATGGFWFTDHGKSRGRDRDITGVFYAQADGSSIEEKIFPLEAPNGVGLSPDQQRLFVAETLGGRVWFWNLAEPGVIDPHPRSPHGGYLVAGLPGLRMLDSLAVDAAGRPCVATLIRGGITVFDVADGGVEDDAARTWHHVPTDDPMTTNICFGGEELQTAWVTLSGTGRLARAHWPVAGARLAF